MRVKLDDDMFSYCIIFMLTRPCTIDQYMTSLCLRTPQEICTMFSCSRIHTEQLALSLILKLFFSWFGVGYGFFLIVHEYILK